MAILDALTLDYPNRFADCLAIRIAVFVNEQGVPADEEPDENDPTAHHILVLADGTPVGTCRWRQTDNGIKLERFAVLAAWRKAGVGRLLLQTAIQSALDTLPGVRPLRFYMHAQQHAMPFYAKAGFVPYGEPFDECGIPHRAMELLAP